MVKFLNCVLFFLLSGCASVYTPPKSSLDGTALSTISGTHQSQGLARWQTALVTSIDDKNVSYLAHDLTFNQRSQKIIPVTSGSHNFIVSVDFARGFLAGPYEALVEINAVLKPATNYQVQAAVEGRHVNAWITDEAGKTVSEVAQGVYQAAKAPVVVTQP
jgi:uncharacterized protein YceK